MLSKTWGRVGLDERLGGEDLGSAVCRHSVMQDHPDRNSFIMLHLPQFMNILVPGPTCVGVLAGLRHTI